MLSFDFKRRCSIQQLILCFLIFKAAFLIVVKENTSFVILVVNLPKVAILTTTHLLFLYGLLHFSKVSLVTNKHSIAPQVLIGVVGVGLQGFGSHAFAKVLHLLHLVFVETNGVTVIRERIW